MAVATIAPATSCVTDGDSAAILVAVSFMLARVVTPVLVTPLVTSSACCAVTVLVTVILVALLRKVVLPLVLVSAASIFWIVSEIE